MRLQGRTALVTGSARGIGKAIAMRFAKEGADIVVVDLDLAAAEATAGEIAALGRKSMARKLDVTDLAAAEALAAEVQAELGPISILVNNAGVIFPSLIGDDDAAKIWERTLAVNLGGAFNMCRSFEAQLKQNGGAVINIGSIRSFVGAPNQLAYVTTKGGIMQFTKSLAVEWAEAGVRVNAIAPGFIDTDLVPSDQKTAAREAGIIATTPMRRQGQPEDLAGAAAFLASDDAAYVTGIILPVDGGFLASG